MPNATRSPRADGASRKAQLTGDPYSIYRAGLAAMEETFGTDFMVRFDDAVGERLADAEDHGARLTPEALDKRLSALEAKAAGSEEVVRTRRLEVVDSQDRVRAVIGGPEDLFGLTIYDENGAERIFLHFTEDGHIPGLHFSAGGNVVASFGMVDDEKPAAILAMSNPGSDSSPLIDFEVKDDESYVSIGNAERPHVSISSASDSAGVSVADDGGVVQHRLDADSVEAQQ